MRTVTLVAFLAVAFTAIAAAPHTQTSVVQHKLNTHVGVKAIDEDFLLDLISLILGVDVREIIAQAEATITGLEALLESSSNELVDILAAGGADVIAEAEAIINAAIAEAKEVVAPIVKIIQTIISLISGKVVPNNLIEDLVKLLVNQILNLIDDTISGLEAVVVSTVEQLTALANSAGQNIAAQVEALLAKTVAEGLALVLPLLKLLEPLIPSGIAVNGVVEDLIVELIRLITGLDIPAIIAQAKATAEGLAQLGQQVAQDLEQVLGSSGKQLVSEVQAVLAEAAAEAEKPINNVVNLVQKLLDGGNPVLLVPLLVIAVDNASKVLPQIVENAVNQLVAIVSQIGSDVQAQVEQILATAAVEAKALIQALLDLLPPATKARIAFRA